MSSKLFVGNLSFKTREPDLAKFFEQVGPVKSTNIIARGPRSLGYGFVEFEHEADAAKAVEQLNKKELDGRPINVELAKTREAGFVAPAQGQQGQQQQQRPQRRPRFPRAPMQGNTQAQAPQGQQGQVQQQRPQRRPRFPRAPMQGNNAAAAAPAQQQGELRQRRPRPLRRPREIPANQEPSKTTLFVANLPFIVDDEGLNEIFEGMKVKEAHVVTRPNGRSKGYGFVTFENEADCKHALEAVDKSIVEGRDITVRPAMAPFRKTETTAPATTSTTTTAAPVTPATTTTTTTAPAEAKPESPAAK